MESLVSRLKREGYKQAAAVLVYHNQIRALPSHSRETLLVHGVTRRNVISRCLGALDWEIPDTYNGLLPNGWENQAGTLGAPSGATGVPCQQSLSVRNPHISISPTDDLGAPSGATGKSCQVADATSSISSDVLADNLGAPSGATGKSCQWIDLGIVEQSSSMADNLRAPSGAMGKSCQKTDQNETGQFYSLTDKLGASFEATGASCQLSAKVQGPQTCIFTADVLAKLPHPTDVTILSTKEFKKEVPPRLIRRYTQDPLPNAESANTKAHKMLIVQKPAVTTSFKLTTVISTEMLPGGYPVIDHQLAFLEQQTAWKKVSKSIKDISERRITTPDTLPEVRELEIGTCTPNDYRMMARWIDEKHRETIARYGVCVPALDVEELQLTLMPGEPHWDTRQWSHTKSKFKAMLGNAKTGGKNITFPVLMMYGGIGWQVHLRIPVVYKGSKGKEYIEIPNGVTDNDDLVVFFNHFKPATGTGIEKDVKFFLSAVNAMNHTCIRSDEIAIGIPLDTLAKLSGISHSQSSLMFLTYVVLGGILAKDWRFSVGDNLWGVPYWELGRGLRAYLAGDIQQVSCLATVLMVTWMTHLIPDGEFLAASAEKDPFDFIADFVECVTGETILLSDVADQLPVVDTRKELFRAMKLDTDNEYFAVTSCPDWPAITSGGVRNLKATREFSSRVISVVLKRISYGTGPNLDSILSALQEIVDPVTPLLNTPVATPTPSPVKMERTPPPPLLLAKPRAFPCGLCSKQLPSIGDYKAHVLLCQGEEEMEWSSAPPTSEPMTTAKAPLAAPPGFPFPACVVPQPGGTTAAKGNSPLRRRVVTTEVKIHPRETTLPGIKPLPMIGAPAIGTADAAPLFMVDDEAFPPLKPQALPHLFLQDRRCEKSGCPRTPTAISPAPAAKKQALEEKTVPAVKKQAPVDQPAAAVKKQAAEEKPAAAVKKQAAEEKPAAAIKKQAAEKKAVVPAPKQQAPEPKPAAAIKKLAAGEIVVPAPKQQAPEPKPAAATKAGGGGEESGAC